MWILTTVIAALIVLVVSVDASWSNVLSASRNELVFENRVKEYGAFQLRREEPRNLFYAVFLGIGLVLLGAMGLGMTSKTLATSVPSDVPMDWSVLPPLPPTDQKTEQDDPAKDDATDQQDQGTAAAGVLQDDTTPVVVDDAPASDDDVPEEPLQPLLLGGGGTPGGPSLGGNGNAGNGTGPGGNENPTPEPVVVAEFMPMFPGGDAAMMAFMQKHISLSERDKDIGIRGTLWITFVVRKSGEITDVRVMRGLGQKTDVEESAVRAAQKMPRWIPGRMGEIPVDVRMTMPVRVEVRN